MNTVYDAVIVGGGPGGSTAGLVMARAGLRVCLIEKDEHPRFHIGESILPRTEALLLELGLSERVRALPHLPKYGAEFAFGDKFESLKITFKDGLLEGFPIFNIERAHLDRLLIEVAQEAGVEVRQKTALKSIVRLTDGDVEISTTSGNISARILIDASGQGTVVGRYLGTRRDVTDPHLKKVAYFEHFAGVEQLPGDEAGHPGIIMSDEGWFWMIGLTKEKTSVGFVTRPSFVKELKVPPTELLQWAISRCPVVRHRMRNAVGPVTNLVQADFSYTCAPYAGPGYFMVGDAACFLDPIFSTGFTLALMGGNEVGSHVITHLRDGKPLSSCQREYRKFIKGSTAIFWGMIRAFYQHSFRELFMNGRGPLQIHNAVISVLAGQVFPKPCWALRWRLVMFLVMVRLQRLVPLVPRRRRFSLMSTPVMSMSPMGQRVAEAS